jgi:hypothetical protein
MHDVGLEERLRTLKLRLFVDGANIQNIFPQNFGPDKLKSAIPFSPDEVTVNINIAEFRKINRLIKVFVAVKPKNKRSLGTFLDRIADITEIVIELKNENIRSQTSRDVKGIVIRLVINADNHLANVGKRGINGTLETVLLVLAD